MTVVLNKNIGSFDHYIQLTVKDVKTNWTKRAKNRDTCPLLTRKRDSHRSKYYFTLFVPGVNMCVNDKTRNIMT